jgi:hypothetical protein
MFCAFLFFALRVWHGAARDVHYAIDQPGFRNQNDHGTPALVSKRRL